MTDSTTLQQDLDALVKRHGLAGALLSSFHAHPTDTTQGGDAAYCIGTRASDGHDWKMVQWRVEK